MPLPRALRWLTTGLFAILAATMAGAACDRDEPGITNKPCQVDRGFPYPPGIPYTGVHANAQSNDLVACDSASSYIQMWYALEGRTVAQPNTFSPDEAVTYITSSQPAPGDCNLHAARVADGEVLWCEGFDTPTIWSAVEVGLDGHLFLTTGTSASTLLPV